MTLQKLETVMCFGKYRIEQGENNPCENKDQLWLYNGIGEGMEVRSADIESLLDKFFKDCF